MICLVRPPAVESFRFATTSITLPLGLAYIAAALEAAGREVRVFDAVGDAPDVRTAYYKGYLVGARVEDLARRIPRDAEFVGISCIFTHEWPVVVRLVALLKDANPDRIVVLGGEHTTAMPEFCLMTSRTDCIVLGEGEETIVELARVLRDGGDLSQIAGLAYREDGSIAINRRRDRATSIDSISVPAWPHFEVERYHRHRFVGGMYSDSLTIPMLATRGCPYQCTYCSAPNMWTPRWIPRDPVAVVDEIESYIERYGARNFPFQDLTAIIQKDWIVNFCREALRRGLEFTWQLPTGTRSEAIDDEVAMLLKKTGMVSMAYAPESGSEETRRFIKKKMREDRLFESIAAAVGAKLNVAAFLVIGFPHDRPEHLAKNLGFIDRLAAAGVTDVSVGFYMALPGTELFHSLYDAGEIRLDRSYFRHILDSLALVPSQSYSAALGRVELTRWKFRLYRRFYGAKRRLGARSGFVASVVRAARGLAEGRHDSKLQTAARNGLTSAADTLRVQFGRRWLDRAAEREMFALWDASYRRVRVNRLAQGVSRAAPRDTRKLHENNVITTLRDDHGPIWIAEADARQA